MKWYQRLLVPIVYWANWVWARIIPRPIKMDVPTELLPLLQVGTIAMRYCEYIERSPENLKISERLERVMRQEADQDTMIFVRKILTSKAVIDTTFDWLVHLGDAKEYDREGFKVYLTLPRKT